MRTRANQHKEVRFKTKANIFLWKSQTFLYLNYMDNSHLKNNAHFMPFFPLSLGDVTLTTLTLHQKNMQKYFKTLKKPF